MGALGMTQRPADLSDMQACAAVGQLKLMAVYAELFAKHDLQVAQVLLTHDDLEHRERHLNARNTLVSLLEKGVVPIINENDAVSYTELKFGDNDWLAALVACLLPADLLVILTTDADIKKLAGGTLSATAVGGMEAKLRAAKMTARTGIPMVIASGKKKRVLANIIDGGDEGTFFTPRPGRLKGHKRRIAFFHHPKGSLWVDDGARDALRDKGKSLLPPGVAKCNGDFAKGDVVRLCDINGTEFARGISRFDADEIRARKLKGIEIVHRNDLVIL
jgi:glutamate 5-kinase